MVLGWLLLWQLAAVCTDNPVLLAGPVEVLQAFGENLCRADFWQIVFVSFSGISLGFFAALAAGLLLGALGYRYAFLQELLAPPMAALKSIPVASFVVILLIWFGASRISFCISFLIVLPNVYVNTLLGLQSTDRKLLEMAEVFRVSAWDKFLYLYRPALLPYLRGCLKISLGMSWKSGVAAELIGLPEHSLGERLYMSKIYLDTAGVFAWTLTVILLSFLFEKAVLALLELLGTWMPGQIYTGANPQSEQTTETAIAGHPVQRSETAAAANPCVIQAADLSKRYGEQSVLEHVSFTLQSGRRYLLMAPSGAGKTTLLRLLTALEPVDDGTIQGIEHIRISMVFQEDRLCEELNAIDNIMLTIKCHKRDTGAMRQSVRAQAEELLPQECLQQPVRELSGGMRRRVCLLRAVLAPSQLLLLDEPFNGLDDETKQKTAAYLRRMQAGRTMVVTTHCREDAELLQGEILRLGYMCDVRNIG